MTVPRVNEALETRIGRQGMEVFIVAHLKAVPRPKRDGSLEMLERNVGISLQCMSRRQRVFNVLAIGSIFVRLAQVHNSEIELSSV